MESEKIAENSTNITCCFKDYDLIYITKTLRFVKFMY